eukprot:gene20474-24531_t
MDSKYWVTLAAKTHEAIPAENLVQSSEEDEEDSDGEDENGAARSAKERKSRQLAIEVTDSSMKTPRKPIKAPPSPTRSVPNEVIIASEARKDSQDLVNMMLGSALAAAFLWRSGVVRQEHVAAQRAMLEQHIKLQDAGGTWRTRQLEWYLGVFSLMLGTMQRSPRFDRSASRLAAWGEHAALLRLACLQNADGSFDLTPGLAVALHALDADADISRKKPLGLKGFSREAVFNSMPVELDVVIPVRASDLRAFFPAPVRTAGGLLAAAPRYSDGGHAAL